MCSNEGVIKLIIFARISIWCYSEPISGRIWQCGGAGSDLPKTDRHRQTEGVYSLGVGAANL